MTDPTTAAGFDGARPRRRDGVLAEQLDDDLALFDPASRELLVLNTAARLVWECCDGSGTVAEIVADIAEVFAMDPDLVRRHVHGLLVDWSARGLLAPGERFPRPSGSPLPRKRESRPRLSTDAGRGSVRATVVGNLLLAAVGGTAREGPSLAEELERATSAELTYLGPLAVRHRVAGVVYQALRHAGLDHEVVSSLRQEYLSAATRHLTLLSELAKLAPALAETGRPWVVIKGPVLAELSYGNAGLRTYADLDVLTTAHDVGTVLEAIERHGGTCLEGNWPLLSSLLHGELTLRRPGGALVDLHWHVVYSPAARARFSLAIPELLERAVPAGLGGVHAPVLEPSDELLHLCLHGALSGGHQLVWLKDIERVVHHRQPAWEAVVQRAARYGLGLPTALMLDRAARLLGADVPSGLVAELAPDRLLLSWWRRQDRRARGARWARATRTGRTLMAATSRTSLDTLRCLLASLSTEAQRRRVGTWGTAAHQRPEDIFRHVGGPVARDAFLARITAEEMRTSA